MESDHGVSPIRPMRVTARKDESQKLETLGVLTDSHQSEIELELEAVSSSVGSPTPGPNRKVASDPKIVTSRKT